MPYAYASHESLLKAFEETFAGRAYLHRKQNLGNVVSERLYYDLRTSGLSPAFNAALATGSFGINRDTRIPGFESRRGDGAFGRFIPGQKIVPHRTVPGESAPLSKAPIAQVEIGIETKILAKAMIKQLTRVKTDLNDQVEQFRETGGNPIAVALVGVNYAASCVSFEKDRVWPTTGKHGFLHPVQEAAAATQQIKQKVQGYDEMLFLPFLATNEPPYQFAWQNFEKTRLEYGAVLTRVALLYQQRFPGV